MVGDRFPDTIEEIPIEAFTSLAGFLRFLAAQGVRNAVRGLPRKPPLGGRRDTEWKLGHHKSQRKWENRMRKRGWTEENITEAIKNGKEYKLPARKNKVNKGNPLSRYEHPKTGFSVIRDEKTKEILMIGGESYDY